MTENDRIILVAGILFIICFGVFVIATIIAVGQGIIP